MRGLVFTAVGLCAAALAALAVSLSHASFTVSLHNPQLASAAADFLAPTASASVIVKAQGGVAGYVHAGGSYFVYAQVADSGNPASGVASVKANVSSLTPGQSAAVLGSGSYVLDGVSYGYRSAELKAGAGIPAGSASYALTLADAAANQRSQSFPVTVDNGPLAAASFATANVSGGTAGKAEKGDTVSFSFGKPPDPGSLLAGWNGTATTVSVSIADSSPSDRLTVNGGAIPLGSVALGGNYTASGKTSTFAGSTMTLSGATVTIVLGGEPAGNARTETTKHQPVWTPSASVYDLAGNACSTAPATSANTRQF